MTTFNSANAPALDLAMRAGTLSLRDIAALGRGAAPGFPMGDSVRDGIIYLWHDHWNKAHEIAQSDEGEPDHDFLHGIAHRREGDYGNAKYWFRSAGRHPCLALVAARARAVLNGHPLSARLAPEGTWKPSAFVDLVRDLKNGGDEPLLRALQAMEMIAFHDWLLGGRE